ncbi:hypothetical protein [Cystobacter fuscus]|uniref:hypothetical protein n=1 Tax=Cystobacter fuscus TaxID=43 RepID=UPI0012FD4B54|nr:hypothetical protein [Cystobacter fuscus]
MATSVASPAVVSEYEGPPLHLTTQAPTTTRHLKVRLTSEEYSFNLAEVSLTAQLTVRWKPTDPNRTEKPRFLMRLYVQPDHYGADVAEVLVLEEPGQPMTLQTYRYMSPECKPEQDCEWTIPMELELQPNAAEGSVDVEWKVTAEASAKGTSTLPKGFTVHVSEQ